MPGQFNYEVRGKYPHLIGEDTELWTRFINAYPRKFDTVDYDVHVGSGANTEILPELKDKKYWKGLTQKRIDVVAWKHTSPTIIEVKKRTTLFTLGQILGYRFLYIKDHPGGFLPKTLIVCSTIEPDDILCLNYYKIPFIVI